MRMPRRFIVVSPVGRISTPRNRVVCRLLSRCSGRVVTRRTSRGLLRRDHIDHPDVGRTGEQVRRDLAERARDLTVYVRLSGLLGLERIEDPERRLAEAERVPGDGARLRGGERAAGLEERCELLALVAL